MCGWEGNEGERKEKEKQRMEEKGLDECRHRAAIEHVRAFLRSPGPEAPRLSFPFTSSPNSRAQQGQEQGWGQAYTKPRGP